jgi:hypothetical protein
VYPETPLNWPLSYKRRSFLQAAGTLALVSLLPVTSYGSSAERTARLDLKQLSQHTARVLQHMLRLLFPHDTVDDAPYIAIVTAFDQTAAAQPEFLTMLNLGVQKLDLAGPDQWLKLPQKEQLELLAMIEPTPFFQTVRVTGRFIFYDNKDVWAKLGYEGSSYQHGGYLNHGFNDLDWLPEPEG